MTITTKFNIGDELFYMNNENIQSGKVASILINVEVNGTKEPRICYNLVNSRPLLEEKAFGSKEEIAKHWINSQGLELDIK